MMMTQTMAMHPRFGMQYSDDPENMPECCRKRKMGLPVSCCPPLPPDQVVTSLPWVKKEEPAAAPDQRNVVLRLIAGIVDWVKAFFQGLIQDLKRMFIDGGKH